MTPQAGAVVAAPQTPWLSIPAKSLTAAVGGTLEVPVDVHGPGPVTALDLNVDLCTSGVATGFTAPQSVAVKDGKGCPSNCRSTSGRGNTGSSSGCDGEATSAPGCQGRARRSLRWT